MRLVIPLGPGVPTPIEVPREAITERFSRASGPGGQGVNTTDSRVELEVSLTGDWLSEAQQRRVVRRLGDRVLVVASEHREQRRNRTAARERAAEMIREALAPPPPPRRPTKPTRGSKERRLEAKKRRGQTKAGRGRIVP